MCHPTAYKQLPYGRGLRRAPLWQRLIVISCYVPPLSLLVHQFTCHPRPEIAAALARLLLAVRNALHISALPPLGMLVSVLLHAYRQWRRRFNQSDLLCWSLSRWLMDDVVTTGSTVAEICRLLLRSGAATVQVWCLCRTL